MRIFITCSLILLTSCEVTKHYHGSYVTNEDVLKVKKGDTKQAVRQILGTPFIESNGNRWLYIGRSEERIPFRPHVYKECINYAVSFDSSKKVISVEKLDLKEADIQFDKDKTDITKK